MNIALYGGSFDPPHPAHVRAARLAWESLRPDKLIIMPAASPPHKRLSAETPGPQERLILTQIAFAELEMAEVSELELMRGGASYTSDTIRELKALYPGASLTLIMGADMLLSLEHWHEAGFIMREASIAAISREDGDMDAMRAHARELSREYGADIRFIDAAPLPMSSSDMRARLRSREGADMLKPEVYARIIERRDYGAKPELSWLREQVRPHMTAKRMEHCLGCEREAVRLAERWGADTGDAAEAGILHDITKKLDMQEQLLLAEKYGIVFDKLSCENIKLMHAQTGAALSRELFGVTDEVYSAIRWHTTGRADMSLLEKIIYLADYIEPTRSFEGVERLRQLAYADLDAAMVLGLQMSLDDLREKGTAPHADSVSALRWFDERKN